MTGSKAKKKSLRFLTIFILFCFIITPFLYSANSNVSAIIEGSHTYYPVANNAVVINQKWDVYHYINYIHSDSANIKEKYLSYSNVWYAGNIQTYTMTWGFKTAGGGGSYGIIPPDDPFHINITAVEIHVAINNIDGHINGGYLSFCTDYPDNNNPSVDSVYFKGNWTTTGQYSFAHLGPYESYYNLFWNITGLRAWTITDLVSEYSFRVSYRFTTNFTVQNIDYVGIRYWYTFDNLTGTFGYPTVTTGYNINGLLWLFIMFTPTIAISQYVPKIGFVAGITIMLIILGATQSGFLPTMIIGIVGVAVLMYKGV